MKQTLYYISLILLGIAIGLLLAKTESGKIVSKQTKSSVSSVKNAVIDQAVTRGKVDARIALLIENPALRKRMDQGGSFGGEMSISAAQNMFGRDPKAIKDMQAKTYIEAYGDNAWLIRMPIVNAVLFDTDEGLVLVDTGMAPAGPALLDAIRSVSDKPIHTIIYTHGHVDHAYGTWALLDAGETPQIIAQENILQRFNRYIELRQSMAKYMNQKAEQMPLSLDDIALPTQVFSDRLELTIGNERFILQHHKGETDDQLYVWLPDRKILATADYYQGFMPNAGNGKRVQRHIKEWIVALREMAGLGAELMLPAHGEALTKAGSIQSEFNLLANAFESIRTQAIDGLNQGLRKDQIFQSITLPDELAHEHTPREQYVSYEDVSKMVLKRYTGWWNDLPSQWTPAPLEKQATAIVDAVGGIEKLITMSRHLQHSDIQLACHFTDWAWLANSNHPAVQQLVIDIYTARILDPKSNTQEILAYLDVMADARARQANR